MYSAKASFLSKRNTCIFMLATDSLQYPLCSDTLLSPSCREEFIMKKSFVQSPFCVPTAPRYLLTQQEGPSHAERAQRAPSPALSSWLENKQQKLHKPALCSTTPYKTFVFLSKKAFQELCTQQ